MHPWEMPLIRLFEPPPRLMARFLFRKYRLRVKVRMPLPPTNVRRICYWMSWHFAACSALVAVCAFVG